jgi:ABC-type nickel/cobalt efflux system permease component RcnA
MLREIGHGVMRYCPLAVLLGLVGSLFLPSLALAHPLGNFTVNRYSRLDVSAQTITIQYALDLAEIPTFQAMTFLDPNGTGVVTDAAKAAYASQRLAEIVPNLHLTVGGAAIPLRVTSSDLEILPGQGDLHTLWLGATLTGSMPDTLERAGSSGLALDYRDANEPDRIGWREIVVRGVDGVTIANASVSSTDVSNELRNYPTNLLTTPLNEREAKAIIVAPGQANVATAVTGAAASATGALGQGIGAFVGKGVTELIAILGDSGAGSTAPIQGSDTAPGLVGAALGQASSLSEIVAAGRLGPFAIALAFVLAALWGAAHAFTPGHGKTIVAAYLVGSRGTARHAMYLGLTVTATHTLGIYALGVLTLVAARFVLPETLYPWLALVAGTAVVAVGLVTLVSRTRQLGHKDAAYHHHHGPHDHAEHHHDHSHHDHVPEHHSPAKEGLALVGTEHEYAHAHGLAHDHLHHPEPPIGTQPVENTGPDHHHDHDAEHGHSHLPPGTDGAPVTWRNLLALGVAGGILPCPSALVLLLGAIALGQVAFGLALVAAFSVGLAGVLIGIGIAFVYARQLVTNRGLRVHPRLNRLLRLAPIGSAALIALIGLAMTLSALGQTGLLGRL